MLPIGLLAGLLLVALILWRPVVCYLFVIASVALVEQGPGPVPIATDHVPIFQWPTSLAGQPDRPIGYLMLLALAAIAARRLIARERILVGGELIGPFCAFLLCVVVGTVHGLVSGGDMKIIVVEVRPLWYLFLSYLLAVNLVTSRHHLRAFFWIIIFGAGAKAAQGVYLVEVTLHGDLTNHRDIMAHEDSFFFIAILLLIGLFALYRPYWPHLGFALLLAPLILFTLVANNRRADYVALLVGLGISWLLVFQIRRAARVHLVIGLIVVVLALAGYTAAFRNSAGSLGEPARAVMSVFQPSAASAEDISSNMYRYMENYDLRYTVKQHLLLGLGYGKPFSQPYRLPNILSLDPYYLFIPHNTIYWVWMRLGPIGFGVFWYLIGSIIMRGCVLARRLRDPYFQIVAIFTVSITAMEIIVAFADYQLFFYRNVIYLGLLAGTLMRLAYIERVESQATQLLTNTAEAGENAHRQTPVPAQEGLA